MVFMKSFICSCADMGELNEHLHELADRLGIADHISFLGYREDMLEIFGASDIFLFPSFQEGLPRAMLEPWQVAFR